MDAGGGDGGGAPWGPVPGQGYFPPRRGGNFQRHQREMSPQEEETMVLGM